MNTENFQQVLDKAISEIIDWFKNVYPDHGGIPYYAMDGDTGNPLGNRNLLPELDDYLPFFWMLGEHDFVLNQIAKLKQNFNKNPMLFTHPQIRCKKGFGIPGPLRSRINHVDIQDYVEILYGLLEIYELSKERSHLNLAVRIFEHIVKNFYRKGCFRSFRLSRFPVLLNVTEAMSGMFIEVAVDLFLLTTKKRYLDIARECAYFWISQPLFQSSGIFPSVVLKGMLSFLPGAGKFDYFAELAKPNTSMASGLLALASPPVKMKEAMSALEKWVEGLERYFLIKKSAVTAALAHTPQLMENDYGPILSTNFAAMDVLCDLYMLSKNDHYLGLAEKIGEFFIDHQSFRTGLFPDEPGEKRSYLDANTDLAVTLAKISELTGKSHYREAGLKAIKGILDFHRAPFGYYRDVHMESGEVINNVVETRFVSLLLKPLILFRDDLKIFDEKGSWSKFRDR